MQGTRRNWGMSGGYCWPLAAGCQNGSEPMSSNGGTVGTGGTGAPAALPGRPERQVAPARPGRAAPWAQAVQIAGTGGSAPGPAPRRRDRRERRRPGRRGGKWLRERAAGTGRPAAAARPGPRHHGTTGTGGSGSGTLTLTGLTIEANPKSVLSCFVNWTTSAAASSVVQFGAGKYEWEIADTAAVTTHRVLVIGMHAQQAYQIKAISTNSAGSGSARRDVHDRHAPRSDPGRPGDDQ